MYIYIYISVYIYIYTYTYIYIYICINTKILSNKFDLFAHVDNTTQNEQFQQQKQLDIV